MNTTWFDGHLLLVSLAIPAIAYLTVCILNGRNHRG